MDQADRCHSTGHRHAGIRRPSNWIQTGSSVLSTILARIRDFWMMSRILKYIIALGSYQTLDVCACTDQGQGQSQSQGQVTIFELW